MAIHLPTGPLKTRSGLKPITRSELTTYQPISRWLSHCAIGVGNRLLMFRGWFHPEYWSEQINLVLTYKHETDSWRLMTSIDPGIYISVHDKTYLDRLSAVVKYVRFANDMAQNVEWRQLIGLTDLCRRDSLDERINHGWFLQLKSEGVINYC